MPERHRGRSRRGSGSLRSAPRCRGVSLLWGLSLLTAVCWGSTPSQAETITLKTGQKIHGTILQKTAYTLIVRLAEGGTLPVWLDQIDHIEPETPGASSHAETTAPNAAPAPPPEPGSPATPTTAEAKTAAVSQPDAALLALGIQFIPPPGWRRDEAHSTQVVHAFQSPDQQASMAVNMPVAVRPGASEFVWELQKATLSMRSVETRTMMGVPCRIYVADQRGNNGGHPLRSKGCQCIKDNKLYFVIFATFSEAFDRYLPEADAALATFDTVAP